MFVLFYFIQSFFNYLFSEFYRGIGVIKNFDSFEFIVFIQCLNCLFDEMYGYGPEKESVVVKPIVLYENKYVDKYNNLIPSNDPDKDKEELKKRFIIEMTPIGNVIMQYDVNKEAFVYYSDSMIPFRYLETVARKYVCTYNCKELYIERREVVQKNTVDASLPKKPVKTKDLIQLKRNVAKPDVPKIEVEMNRYSNLGRFSNFNMLQKVERHVTDKKRLLTFSDFKRQSVM